MPALLWDVQREHLSEAEFCFETWDRALSSPLYTLADVRNGPEERLMAHTMGLVIGGQPVSNVDAGSAKRSSRDSTRR